MAGRFFLFLVLSLVVFLVSLVVSAIVSSASSEYRATLYVRPNTTLVLRGACVPNTVRILQTAAAINVYDRATQIEEYSLSSQPISLDLVRWMNTNSSYAVPLGQTQGQLQVSVLVTDVYDCLGNTTLKFSVQTTQNAFSYTPWEFNYLHEIRPGAWRTQNVSSNVDECFQGWLLMYSTNSPVDLRASEVVAFYPPDYTPQDSAHEIADAASTRALKTPLRTPSRTPLRRPLTHPPASRRKSPTPVPRLGKGRGMLSATTDTPLHCTYRLDIRLTSYTYDVTSLPNLIRYAPNELSDDPLYPPIAIQGNATLGIVTAVSFSSGTVTRQGYGVTQIICLTVLLGVVFTLGLVSFITEQCLRAARNRKIRLAEEERRRQETGDVLTYSEKRKLEAQEHKRRQEARIARAKARRRREREAEKQARLEARIAKRSLARRAQGSKTAARTPRRK